MDYIGGTNEKTRESNDSLSDTNSCARNLGDEYKNKKDEEYIETSPVENDKIKSKISEDITEDDFIISLKVIKIFILSIDTYEQDMIVVGNQNKKNQN